MMNLFSKLAKLAMVFEVVTLILGSQRAPAAILAGPVTNAANGHVYYLLAPASWTASEAEAVRLGGHLATINDAAENHWIAETFGEWDLISRGLWIGLHDSQQEGQYRWISGATSEYRNWWRGEPVDPDGSWDYVHITWPNVTHPGEWRSRQDLSHYLGLPICGVVEVEPEPDLAPVSVAPAVEIAWLSLAGAKYQVQWREAVGSGAWSNLGASVTGNGTTNRVYDGVTLGAKRFYRVARIAPEHSSE